MKLRLKIRINFNNLQAKLKKNFKRNNGDTKFVDDTTTNEDDNRSQARKLKKNAK